MKQEVRYAANRTAQYQTPVVKKSSGQLTATKILINLDTLFNFAVTLDMENQEEEGMSGVKHES